MKNLLVPVDGSGAALRALDQAVALARLDPGCSIHLVHAHEEPLVYGEIAVYVPRAKMAELQREHSEGVLAAAEDKLKQRALHTPAKCWSVPSARPSPRTPSASAAKPS